MITLNKKTVLFYNKNSKMTKTGVYAFINSVTINMHFSCNRLALVSNLLKMN